MDRADLTLVLAIRERGSLSAAAEAMNVAPSVVTKRLAALETRIGQRLFARTTRRLSLTAEGEAVCRHAQRLLEGFAALESELSERQSTVAGSIRLAGTLGFGRRWVGPALADFQQRHPAVQVQIQLTEHLPDLSAEGYDGAIWLWPVQGARATQWTSRRLARNQRVLVAAPTYLAQRGTPATPADLESHDCLVVQENGDADRQRYEHWALQQAKEPRLVRVRVRGPLSSNSGELVRDWCLAGRGIMLRSLWDIAPQLASGALVRLLPAYAMPDADIHWIAPWQPRTPRRTRLLVDFLLERFRGEPWKPAAPINRAKLPPDGRRAPPG
ncbi:LysR family transcriptional regulator [Variovorax ginsengisoli]|uniref:DNA-binding transcriptional LysR family regulator n=1 Tax=Variovorax ginsengisoli TaxID=363844 RepID=A0ABT9S6E5_9BURK|nr:LysR family transcriptional regulator [Variovorax ginsengisoli]MDP9899925.1 DNA-binding transcriptional LysR family regulator [Variovorax ginsengisoli]